MEIKIRLTEIIIKTITKQERHKIWPLLIKNSGQKHIIT